MRSRADSFYDPPLAKNQPPCRRRSYALCVRRIGEVLIRWRSFFWVFRVQRAVTVGGKMDSNSFDQLLYITFVDFTRHTHARSWTQTEARASNCSLLFFSISFFLALLRLLLPFAHTNDWMRCLFLTSSRSELRARTGCVIELAPIKCEKRFSCMILPDDDWMRPSDDMSLSIFFVCLGEMMMKGEFWCKTKWGRTQIKSHRINRESSLHYWSLWGVLGLWCNHNTCMRMFHSFFSPFMLSFQHFRTLLC